MNDWIKEKITNSFDKQKFMQTLGARLVSVKEGEVVIECNYDEKLTQQHGYMHAGALTSIVDSACGYAALTTMPKEADVLSVEFKTNFLLPAKGNKLRATATVFKSGRTLTICDGVVTDEACETVFVKMTATMICLQ